MDMRGRWERPGTRINSVFRAYDERKDNVNFRDWLSYDPATGIFRWLKSNGSKARVGEVAGTKTYYGYIRIKVCKLRIFAHRLAWWFYYGKFPKGEIDHINNNKADNRIENLRDATAAQNKANRGPPKNNKSGVKGIWWSKGRRCWHASIAINNKSIWLGQFETREDARRARRKAERAHQKEFAWTS